LINLSNTVLGRKIYSFLNGKYYFDVIYNHYLVSAGLNLGYRISKELDRGAIELLGPYGLANSLSNSGLNISKLDTGIITTYSLYITIGLISLLFLVFAPVLMDTGHLYPIFSEFRLLFIYFCSAILVLTQNK
jgi:NADH-ubiquinone oxidoreductase chain 5